jgi:hypothetical protein
MAMSDKSTWIEDGTTAFGRIIAGVAGICLVVLLALGWHPPDWLTAGVAAILFYCGIMIAIAQFGEFLWQWIRSK